MKLKLFAKGVMASAKKNAPQLLIAGGIITGAAALITACVQSTKLNDIIEDGKTQMEERQKAVDEGKMMRTEEGEEKPYTQEDCDHDKRAVYFRTALRIAKLYAIPSVLSALSIFLILKGNGLHTARTAQAVAIGNGAIASLNSAKERAREVLGEEKTREIFDGVKGTGEFTENEYTDEDGKKHKIKEEKKEYGNTPDPFTFIFSEETSVMWSQNHLANNMLFTHQEDTANRNLEWQGAVTLNECLKMLGITRTEAGQRIGWVGKEFGGNSEAIFFRTTLLDVAKEEYLIEFNCEGDVSDKLGTAYRMAAKR